VSEPSRVDALRGIAACAIASAAPAAGPLRALGATAPPTNGKFAALDAKIKAGMAQYKIPGVAVGVYYEGQEYVKGYGVTNVDSPHPVDGDSLFRIGSTTKTFTATTIMRLVEQGKVDLDAPVRTYLPNLELMDKIVAERVTVRQLLNHSAGWLGDDYANYGPGNDALAKYVADMRKLPQITSLGQVFAYNNAAVDLAGRLIEVVTGEQYEVAVKRLLLQPLGFSRTGFFVDQLPKGNITASHDVEKGKIKVDPASWTFPRSLDPTGGLISSAREQLRYARFHLSDGTAANGKRVLTAESVVAMRQKPGPGGTITMEIDGVCVSWWKRRTAQGVPVFQHGGSWGGQNSDFYFVPQKRFAMTVLTNSTTGPKLLVELGRSGWSLQHFIGLSNPPAAPQTRSSAELKEYEGRYTALLVPPTGKPDKFVEQNIEIKADNGRLRITGDVEETIAFYRDDYVVATDPESQGSRNDFVRGNDGNIAFYRDRGRLYAKRGSAG
jgi:CubicO group peptidase (beta-lactamase class C family)